MAAGGSAEVGMSSGVAMPSAVLFDGGACELSCGHTIRSLSRAINPINLKVCSALVFDESASTAVLLKWACAHGNERGEGARHGKRARTPRKDLHSAVERIRRVAEASRCLRYLRTKKITQRLNLTFTREREQHRVLEQKQCPLCPGATEPFR